MLELNEVGSRRETVFDKNRIVNVQNDGKLSLTQLWEVILRNKRLPGNLSHYYKVKFSVLIFLLQNELNRLYSIRFYFYTELPEGYQHLNTR